MLDRRSLTVPVKFKTAGQLFFTSCVDAVDAWGQRPIVTGEENVATIERACVDLFSLRLF